MYLSLVINCDTRDGFTSRETSAEHMFQGCRSIDFLTDGIENKKRFLSGFEFETIVFVDEHNKVPENTLARLREIADTVVIRKHDKKFGDIKNYEKFNDLNYLAALQLARGEVTFHMDQDCSCFTSSKESVEEMIGMLNDYKFISYPSYWSPRAVDDPSFGKRTWASTRFFICKRETLKFDTLMNCIIEPEWAYQAFGDSPRRTNWLEHFLSLANNDSVYYPPMDLEKRAIFCWDKYITGVLPKLNKMNYEEVRRYIADCGNIHYPVDLTCKNI